LVALDNRRGPSRRFTSCSISISSSRAWPKARRATWSGTRPSGCSFGLLVTLVWLYIEFLRLLAKLRER